MFDFDHKIYFFVRPHSTGFRILIYNKAPPGDTQVRPRDSDRYTIDYYDLLPPHSLYCQNYLIFHTIIGISI